MSIRCIQWVWDHSKASGTDMVVLQFIANCANEEGDNAYPSIATLAIKARVKVRAVQRSISYLVSIGELEVDEGAGRNGTNMYRIPMRVQNDTPVENDTPPVSNSTPPPLSKTTPKPLLEPSKNQIGKSGKKVLKPDLQDYDIDNPDHQEAAPIPESLQNPAFLQAWREWLEFRRDVKKKPVTVRGARTTLKDLTILPDPVARIDRAIEAKWTGLVFDDDRARARDAPQSSENHQKSRLSL